MTASPAEKQSSHWASRGYTARLVLALLLASIVVGGLNGPGLLLIGQIEMARDGGSLWYPDWMYWQTAWNHIVLGAVIAGTISFVAVMQIRRFTAEAVLRRLAIGPLVAGMILAGVSLMFGGAGMLPVVAMTALAVGIFVVAGLAAGLTRLPAQAASEG